MADQDWQNLLNQSGAVQSQIAGMIPYYQQALGQGLSVGTNLYGTGYQNAANAAGTGYANASNALTGLGNLDLATQQQLLGAGRQVFNMGLDPQNALYDRTLNQLTQQTGATNSMYGLGSSAAGAGVQNQALSNFNIDWQNNQLSRALQGLGGYANAANTAGSYGQAGANALTLAPEYMLQSGQVPYQVAGSLAALPGTLAGTFASQLQSGPLSSAQSIQGQTIPYMNYGQGAQAVPYQQQANNAQSFGSSLASGIGGLGSAIQNAGGFGNFFNGTTGSFGGGDFSGAFTSSPYYSGGGNSYGFTMG
ncbi:hypothetical protein WS87_10965 [Burkholderia sp. MSMB0856]|uniref:hypothetical protein n=1 Tax=Burkholderia sp. MSMB0856 TaxID=1637869 RepID=UPI0007536757|nr:hypothetical protein [Burkholderia sp. MSMB0856]AOJ87157.1 hypothetical protein WS87_10965 [Burkholderia sp. MSMB0856]KVH38862.1 hypothetical protein WS87_05165 [Burkholderia sp. MSMB0856]